MTMCKQIVIILWKTRSCGYQLSQEEIQLIVYVIFMNIYDFEDLRNEDV
jgi:hypothetical protein